MANYICPHLPFIQSKGGTGTKKILQYIKTGTFKVDFAVVLLHIGTCDIHYQTTNIPAIKDGILNIVTEIYRQNPQAEVLVSNDLPRPYDWGTSAWKIKGLNHWLHPYEVLQDLMSYTQGELSQRRGKFNMNCSLMESI